VFHRDLQHLMSFSMSEVLGLRGDRFDRLIDQI
jgi:hypothetical protein